VAGKPNKTDVFVDTRTQKIQLLTIGNICLGVGQLSWPVSREGGLLKKKEGGNKRYIYWPNKSQCIAYHL